MFVLEGEGRMEMAGIDRLRLRASEMINHPVAQIQRWVTIHRLDTDGEREWREVIGALSDTAALDLTINADGSVTVRWERQEREDLVAEAFDADPETAPF
jgi:hypothetical protein